MFFIPSQVKLGLCQILVTDDKEANIRQARHAVEAAAKEGAGIISLPGNQMTDRCLSSGRRSLWYQAPPIYNTIWSECWNGPYATSSFPVYAEPIPTSTSEVFDCVEAKWEKKMSYDDICFLTTQNTHKQVNAKESPSLAMLIDVAKSSGALLIGGSIPEKDQGGKVYNTCVIVGPGNYGLIIAAMD